MKSVVEQAREKLAYQIDDLNGWAIERGRRTEAHRIQHIVDALLAVAEAAQNSFEGANNSPCAACNLYIEGVLCTCWDWLDYFEARNKEREALANLAKVVEGQDL